MRVCSVSSHTAIPRPSEKTAQKTTSQPCVRSQPRLLGRKRAGRERRKVTKMKMPLTMPAISNISLKCSSLLHSQCACLTCQWTLSEQQVLSDIVDVRCCCHCLLRNQRETQNQSSTSSKDKVHGDENHHQFGRHGGGKGARSGAARRTEETVVWRGFCTGVSEFKE